MISFKHQGSFGNSKKFLTRAIRLDYIHILEKYAREGVEALSLATPMDSGKTANSWTFEVRVKEDSYTIYWNNTNVVDGVPIAVILQYGHGTKNGGYVVGRDYINPAIQPVFDKIANHAWVEVTKL